MKRRLYWAYGSNLNVQSMRHRCPKAEKHGPLTVADGALVFRGVADVVIRKGSQVQGGLWWITEECERNLDLYEGVAGGLYIKRYLLLLVNGRKEKCLYYVMRTDHGIMPPSEPYLECIAQGYRDFGLDLAGLDAALRESWDDKKVTPLLRERHDRKKRPALARLLPARAKAPKRAKASKKTKASPKAATPTPAWMASARERWARAMTVHSND